MKHKLLSASAVAAMLIFGSCAYAQVGDIAGTVYSTDILTQVDGRDITGYAIDGQTLIALEDLQDYGFTVYYNDNIRSVFLTKTGEASPNFKPSITRGKVGSETGHYYETDIRAFVNGEEVKAYAIDGKMVACVEELGCHGNRDVQNGILKENQYQMGFTYNDSLRLLSLDTNLMHYGSFDNYTGMMLDLTTPWQPYSCFAVHNDNNWIVMKKMGGIMHGQTLQRYHIAYKSGLYFDAREIVSQAYGLGMEAPVFSEDGTKLYFKNSPYDDYKQMELNSMHIYPIDETEYERAASRIVRSGFNMVINGISTPMYSIGGRDYIRADDLTSCGFTVNESDKTLAVSYSNKAQLGKEPDAISVSGNARKLTELSLVINGEYSDFSNGNPIYTYNDSLFIPLSEIEYDYPYEDTGSSMTYRYDIYAGKAYMSF